MVYRVAASERTVRIVSRQLEVDPAFLHGSSAADMPWSLDSGVLRGLDITVMDGKLNHFIVYRPYVANLRNPAMTGDILSVGIHSK